MSLAETQELLLTMKELMAVLQNVQTQTTALNANAPETTKTLTTFRQAERLALRWLVLAKQMGLPPEVGKAIDKVAELVVKIQMATMSINMLMASNPATAAIGLAGLIGTAATMGNMLEGY